MKGLFITRGVDQQFQLYVDPDTDPNELLRQMIEGVTVRVSEISSSWAKLHIQAPPSIHIIRPDVHCKKDWRIPTGQDSVKREAHHTAKDHAPVRCQLLEAEYQAALSPR